MYLEDKDINENRHKALVGPTKYAMDIYSSNVAAVIGHMCGPWSCESK